MNLYSTTCDKAARLSNMRQNTCPICARAPTEKCHNMSTQKAAKSVETQNPQSCSTKCQSKHDWMQCNDLIRSYHILVWT